MRRFEKSTIVSDALGTFFRLSSSEVDEAVKVSWNYTALFPRDFNVSDLPYCSTPSQALPRSRVDA